MAQGRAGGEQTRKQVTEGSSPSATRGPTAKTPTGDLIVVAGTHSVKALEKVWNHCIATNKNAKRSV